MAAVIIDLDAGAEAKQWQDVCRIMSIDLKAPVASPVPDGCRRLTSSPQVVVHHPGYPDDNSNELFALVATDGSSSAPGVVHTACAIFACKRFDGWLSATRDASKRHAVAPQGFLPVGDYYFRVPSEDSTVNKFANSTLSPYPIELRDILYREYRQLKFSLRTETVPTVQVICDAPGFIFWQIVSFAGEEGIGLCWPYGT